MDRISLIGFGALAARAGPCDVGVQPGLGYPAGAWAVLDLASVAKR
jgi:hypothetical protein